MKIALVAEHADPLPAHRGEPARADSVHICALSRHLAKLGHRPTVYARRNDPEPPDRSRMARGVNVEHLRAGPERPLRTDQLAEHTGAFATALAGRLEEDPPDIIHAFDWTSGLASLSATRATDGTPPGTPVVQTFHSLNVTERRVGLPDRPDRSRMEVAIAGRADGVVVNSADQRFALARMGVPRHRVTVVPYGVDTDHFSNEGGSAVEPWRSRREERGRVIAVTDLVAGGADTLIEAVARLPEAELVIVAAPSMLEDSLDDEARRLELLAKEAGVDDRVALTGPVDRKELPRLLRSADIYASAASCDPYGGAVLEAMACGLPVVATAVGGVAGAVLDGTTGVLLPSARPAVLARVLRRLITESTMRSAHGIAGTDRARSRFTWQRVATETEQIYARARPGRARAPEPAGE